MKRLIQALALVALSLLLLACGPKKPSVFPPSISVQELKVLPDGQWLLTLRIQNNSYGEMDFRSLDGQLQVGQEIPIRLHARFQRDIPALTGDVTQLKVLPTAAMTKALQATALKGSSGSLAYRVSGSAGARPEQEKARRDFSFEGNNWLSPVPGIAQTWR